MFRIIAWKHPKLVFGSLALLLLIFTCLLLVACFLYLRKRMSDPEDNKDVDDTSADSSTDAASATSSPGEKSGSGKKSKAESPKPENGKDKDKPEEKADDNAPPEVVPDESTEEKVATAGSKRKSKVERSRSREKRGSKSKRIENVSDARIGFIGAGRMTDSIIRGFLNPKGMLRRTLFIFFLI